jgi:hypothetical protein
MRHAHDFGPLGGEDAAWLHMEGETNPMVVNGLLELGGTIDLARFIPIVERHLVPLPRFRACVVEPSLGVGVPHWEPDPNFDIARHVERVEIDPSDASLRAFVGRRVSTLLERDRPLWHTYVIDRGSAGTVLLCRIHHAIADGFALMRVLLSMCDEHAPERAAAVTHGTTAGGVLRQAASLTRLVTLPPDPHTLLKTPLTHDKRVAWTDPIPLDRVKGIAHRLSATVNDVLVSAVAGALRQLLGSRGESAPQLRAMVPVNLRNPGESSASLGNHFGLVILGLPVGVADPLERLHETKRRMDRLKSSPEAIVALDVLRMMGWAPPRLEDLGVAFFGKKASLVLTNVPGPREPLHVGGVPITRLVFWVPQAARMGLGVSIFSYAGAVTLGVLADVSLIPDPQVLVDALERELELLAAVDVAEAGAAARYGIGPS